MRMLARCLEALGGCRWTGSDPSVAQSNQAGKETRDSIDRQTTLLAARVDRIAGETLRRGVDAIIADRRVGSQTLWMDPHQVHDS